MDLGQRAELCLLLFSLEASWVQERFRVWGLNVFALNPKPLNPKPYLEKLLFFWGAVIEEESVASELEGFRGLGI